MRPSHLLTIVVSLLAGQALACSPAPPAIGTDGKPVLHRYRYNYTAKVLGTRELVLPQGRQAAPTPVTALELEVLSSEAPEAVPVGSKQAVVYPGIGADCSSEPRPYATECRTAWCGRTHAVGSRVSVRGDRLDAAFVEPAR